MKLKKRIVFDCDCTMGVAGCDVDDGLALLYLLGCPEAELLGITASYGNSRMDVVWDTVKTVVREIGLNGIPIRRGGESAGCTRSEAAGFLAEMVNRYPGEVSVLATGSLTNLMGAWEKDPAFFEKAGEIVLMGGITEPLLFAKKKMNELNFSCDPKAAFLVLTEGKRVSVITGNNCLKVLFTKEDYRNSLFLKKEGAAEYIRKKTDYWFQYNEEDYGIQGFYNWDVTAAVYLMRPELFEDSLETFCLSAGDLKTGYLRREGIETEENTRECQSGTEEDQRDRKKKCMLNLPTVREEKTFKNEIYRAWKQVRIPALKAGYTE